MKTANKKPKLKKLTESEIMNLIKDRFEFQKNVSMFRNNNGVAAAYDFYRKALRKPLQIIRYGLGNGSSDLIGWKSVQVTEDMVGKKIAVFTAIEVKTETGVVSDDQEDFIKDVTNAGGIGIVAKSLEEAEAIL